MPALQIFNSIKHIAILNSHSVVVILPLWQSQTESKDCATINELIMFRLPFRKRKNRILK